MRRVCLLGIGIVFLAGIGIAQDQDTEIEELIEQLSDDNFVVREQAEKRLVEIGARAIEAVREALEDPDAEVRERAQRILAQIERLEQVEKAIQPPPSVNIEFDGTLSDLINQVKEQTGVEIGAGEARNVLDAAVKLTVKDASLFTVMDEICSQLETVSWELSDEGRIRFVKEPFVRMPSFVSGPYRIRIIRTESYWSNEFKSVTSAWAVVFKADVLPGISMFGTPQIQVGKMTDDKGNVVETTNKNFVLGQKNNQNMARIGWGGMGMGGQGSDEHIFIYEADRLVTKLGRIEGKATVYFKLKGKVLRFTDLEKNPTLKHEGMTLTLSSGAYYGGRIRVGRNPQGQAEALSLSVAAPEGDAWLSTFAGKLVEEGSIVAVDRNGKEHVLEATYTQSSGQMIKVVNGQVVRSRGAGSWTIPLGKLKKAELSEIRLRIAGLHRQSIPFEFEGLSLR
jgi:hypothetical protein